MLQYLTQYDALPDPVMMTQCDAMLDPVMVSHYDATHESIMMCHKQTVSPEILTGRRTGRPQSLYKFKREGPN